MLDASALSLSSAYKKLHFQKLTPCRHIFFHLKSFLCICPWTVKIRKRKHRSDFWATSVSVLKYSSLPNRRVARNKRGGGNDEPFFISVVPGISMLVRIPRSVTVIKKRTKWIKVSKKCYKRIKSCLWYKTATVCSLFVFHSLLNTFACISQSFAWFLHVRK